MTATKTTDRDLDRQILEETVRGHFAGKNALMGSILATAGAIRVESSMPGGRDRLNDSVKVPYFGTLGEFSDNPEDNAVTPVVLKSTHETATIARSSLAFEVTRQAQKSGPNDDDPYEEAATQIEQAAIRRMDYLCLEQARQTPLVHPLYSATAPVFLDWDAIVDGQALWGDESDDIVGMSVHSRVEAGLRKLRDATGRPLLIDSMVNGTRVRTFNGIPLVVSDKAALTGSSMGTVTETGAAVGNVTLSGTPLGPWKLKIDIIVGGARGTATFKFSTDDGNTWSDTLTTAASVDLIDTATDSLVGLNGKTGITVAFGAPGGGGFDALSVYSSTALMKATSLIMQRGAMAFWYSAANMALETDKDILKHNDVAAMHMYHVTHRYRRRRGGRAPGVVAITHNVPGFIG